MLQVTVQGSVVLGVRTIHYCIVFMLKFLLFVRDNECDNEDAAQPVCMELTTRFMYG